MGCKIKGRGLGPICTILQRQRRRTLILRNPHRQTQQKLFGQLRPTSVRPRVIRQGTDLTYSRPARVPRCLDRKVGLHKTLCLFFIPHWGHRFFFVLSFCGVLWLVIVLFLYRFLGSRQLLQRLKSVGAF